MTLLICIILLVAIFAAPWGNGYPVAHPYGWYPSGGLGLVVVILIVLLLLGYLR